MQTPLPLDVALLIVGILQAQTPIQFTGLNNAIQTQSIVNTGINLFTAIGDEIVMIGGGLAFGAALLNIVVGSLIHFIK